MIRLRGPLALFAALGLTAFLGGCTTEPKPATALSYVVQPSDGTAGQVISPSVQVGFVDSDRNQVTTGVQADITVALAGGTGSGTLTGTLTQTTANGVATFDDLVVTPAAVGYTLTATAESTPCDPQAVECQSESEYQPITSEGFNMVP